MKENEFDALIIKERKPKVWEKILGLFGMVVLIVGVLLCIFDDGYYWLIPILFLYIWAFKQNLLEMKRGFVETKSIELTEDHILCIWDKDEMKYKWADITYMVFETHCLGSGVWEHFLHFYIDDGSGNPYRADTMDFSFIDCKKEKFKELVAQYSGRTDLFRRDTSRDLFLSSDRYEGVDR